MILLVLVAFENNLSDYSKVSGYYLGGEFFLTFDV